MAEEQALPITPTNEGRKPERKNFGYVVEFNELWPLGLGIAGTLGSGLLFFGIGWRPVNGWLCALLMFVPLMTGHYYIKNFIENALPHRPHEYMAQLMQVRMTWNEPSSRWVPFWPSFYIDDTISPDGGDSLDIAHPLLRLAKAFKSKTDSS